MKVLSALVGIFALFAITQGAFAATIQTILTERVTSRSATVTWTVNPYSNATQTFVWIKKLTSPNSSFRKISNPDWTDVQDGTYHVRIPGLQSGQAYAYYVSVEEPGFNPIKSATFTFLTKVNPRLRIGVDSARFQWSSPRGYVGYVRYATPTLSFDTTWQRATRTGISRREHLEANGLQPNKEYQYQVQLRTSAGAVVSTTDSDLFRTKPLP